MKNMIVLVDTNSILDCLTMREPFETESVLILQSCGEGKITGYIAAHSITNSFYILRKLFPLKSEGPCFWEFAKNIFAIYLKNVGF
ncbi:MAG: hypothetical protein LBC60_03955 [Spirochaetaceae bacterium]|nr:hypothetical protein [Spirochaetaceae bacterium]